MSQFMSVQELYYPNFLINESFLTIFADSNFKKMGILCQKQRFWRD